MNFWKRTLTMLGFGKHSMRYRKYPRTYHREQNRFGYSGTGAGTDTGLAARRHTGMRGICKDGGRA